MNTGKYFKSEFSKNVLTLSSGTAIAQAVTIVIAPVITRLYSPGQYGVYTTFYTILMIFGILANARYEMAIVLPEKNEDAINLVAVGTFISTCLSLFLVLITILFNHQFTIWLNTPQISVWLYFIPLLVFLTGLFNVLNLFNSRIRNYKFIAIANVYKSVSMSIVQLILGFMKAGVAGLITGQIISQFSGNFKLLKETVKDKVLLASVNRERMKYVAKRYIDFPKYNIWSGLSSQLSLNLINLFTIHYFSSATLGFYGLTNRILGLPILVIGTAIGQVFMQEASVEKNTVGNAKKIFNSTLKKLVLMSVPAAIVLFPLIHPLWPIVFGNKWAEAGVYAQILLPMVVLRFITTPLLSIFAIYEKQHLSLIWQFGNLLLIGLMLWSIYLFGLSMRTFLYILSSVSTVYYLILLLLIYRTAKKEGNRPAVIISES